MEALGERTLSNTAEDLPPVLDAGNLDAFLFMLSCPLILISLLLYRLIAK